MREVLHEPHAANLRAWGARTLRLHPQTGDDRLLGAAAQGVGAGEPAGRRCSPAPAPRPWPDPTRHRPSSGARPTASDLARGLRSRALEPDAARYVVGGDACLRRGRRDQSRHRRSGLGDPGRAARGNPRLGAGHPRPTVGRDPCPPAGQRGQAGLDRSCGTLRGALDVMPPRPGAGKVRRLLDRWTLVLTDSELEQRLLPIARAAGPPDPLTGVVLNGFKVDFYWPSLGLVVETDGLRCHRTPAEQARDRVRDQAHAAAGLTALRFTHAQVRYEPGHVERTLRAVATRRRGGPRGYSARCSPARSRRSRSSRSSSGVGSKREGSGRESRPSRPNSRSKSSVVR